MSNIDTIYGYAFLQSAYSSKDVSNPLDALDDIAIRAIIKINSKSFVSKTLQSSIKSVWGLEIPEVVCQYTLGRLARKGVLTRNYDDRKDINNYIPNIEASLIKTIKEKEMNAKAVIERMSKKIDRYLYNQYGSRNISAAEIIERWLDTSSIALLTENFRPEAINKEDIEINKIIARVMGVISGIDDDFVEDLTLVALGDAIYRSVKNITEFEVSDKEYLSKKSKSMENVDVYLDVGILFRALGYFGENARLSAIELLDLCKKTACNLYAFEHTIDELRVGVNAVAHRIKSSKLEAYGPILMYAIENGLDPSDLISSSSRVELELQDLGIRIISKPDHDENLTIDEMNLEYRLEVDVKQANQAARIKDIESLTAIYRLRRGEAKSYL